MSHVLLASLASLASLIRLLSPLNPVSLFAVTGPRPAVARRPQFKQQLARYLAPLFVMLMLFAGLSVHNVHAAAKAAQSGKAQLASVAATVNVNAASAEELSTRLDGVGTSRAEAIVAHRKKHGKFSSLEDLLAVRGIGERVLQANRDRIRFSGG